MTERLSERWRPRTVQDIVGQPTIVPTIQARLQDESPKCWAFTGDPSTGKTTAALCIAELLYDGKYPSVEFLNGSQIKADSFPEFHKQQLVCSPISSCYQRAHHWHILVIDELEYISPACQRFIKTEWEFLPDRAVVIATSNDLSAISDSCFQRFEEFQFDSGPTFEKAALERCVQIWTAEITTKFGVEAPTFAELRRLGDSRDKFSLRTCIGKIEQKLAILTHNATPRDVRNARAEAYAKESFVPNDERR